jgi:hypothetical protein
MIAKEMEKYKKQKSGGGRKIKFPDVTCLSQTVMAAILGITPQSLNAWDCPRNTDGSYSSKVVIDWIKGKVSSKPTEKIDLEKEKLKLQCEKLQLDLDDSRSKNIAIADMEQIFCGRAESLKRYWTEVGNRNLHHFCHKSIEQLRPLWDRFIREAMNTYARNHQ